MSTVLKLMELFPMGVWINNFETTEFEQVR